MSVAVAWFGITLDERVRRNRFRAGIAFVRERVQGYVHLGLSASHDLIRNAESLVVKGTRTEIRVKGHSRADEVDVVRRIGINRRGGNIGVPQITRWKRHKAVQAGELANRHSAAGSGLRKCDSG